MTSFFRQPSLRFTPEEARYYAWLHSHGTCCLTGRIDIEVAHTGGLAQGKGLGRKAPLWTLLPLSAPLHHAEEDNRDQFWDRAGFPGNTRFHWSERLHDIFKANDNPHTLFADMQAAADWDYLATILGDAT